VDTQALGNGAKTSVDENSPPADIIAWTLERFADERMAITTSFGMEGCALIDMYAAHQKPVTVIYLDTMFFFEETHRLRDRMIERYPHLSFVNRGTTLTPEQQAVEHGDELWKTNPDLCCKLRKVYPMGQALTDVDVWITGLRRTQSTARENLRVVDWDWQYQLLKISPIASMDRPQIWEYVKKHDVPYNELHEKGYPTVGCTHCTKPVPGSKIGEYSRAGRWNGNEKTECGLHGYGI
jgi:phosphoadenosine phosphosulfate reductase